METLVNEMVQDDPAKRPKMEQVVSRFDASFKGLSNATFRARLTSRSEQPEDIIVNVVAHWYRRIKYTLQGRPALPNHT